MALNDTNHPHETQERCLMWLKAREANINTHYYPTARDIFSEHSVTVVNEETSEAAEVAGYKNNEWLHLSKTRMSNTDSSFKIYFVIISLPLFSFTYFLFYSENSQNMNLHHQQALR